MINYYLLTKPGIVVGNLVTVFAGFLLASKGRVEALLLVETLLGLSFVMASACVFNNYIDRPLDKKMTRTKKRPLVTGMISGKNAIFYGIALALLGNAILLTTNLLTLAIANIGFFVYVVLYSLWKGKTIYGTAIGSIAGAVPPLVGYVAVSNHFDLGALILFFMLVFWQMPHFFSVAMVHFDDYAEAKLPVLPIMKGTYRTKIHMTIYILFFSLTAASLTFFNYTGKIYLFSSLILGGIWLISCFKGFKMEQEKVWAKHMFRLSLLIITTLSFVIPFDVI